MASINLSDIQRAASEKYPDLDIALPDGSIVRLVPALRLSKARRKELTDLQESNNAAREAGEEVDSEEYIKDFIRKVAAEDGQADALFEAVGEDLATLAEIVSEYSESTQPGEASSSES